MWQSETYDPKTIDQELGYAQSIGFNIIRVFLHNLVWQQNPDGFKQRLSNFLTIADNHKIGVMFVFFDDCWNPEAKLGKQLAPIPGVHNSRWVQAPGYKEATNITLYPVLESYVKDIIKSFANDKRVVVWDLYNEPGQAGNHLKVLALLTKVFQWAREANPSQPITAGVWSLVSNFEKFNELQTNQSDIITFHIYARINETRRFIERFKSYGRPTICTEYMARTIGSTFETLVPIFHKENVGCINWGLVKGKTNTIFPWGSPRNAQEPKVWFHDIFQPDGTPHSQDEIDIIKKYTKKSSKPRRMLEADDYDLFLGDGGQR